jgi:hypothetical protein
MYVKITGYLEIENDEARYNTAGEVIGLTEYADRECIGPDSRTRISDLEDIAVSTDDR